MYPGKLLALVPKASWTRRLDYYTAKCFLILIVTFIICPMPSLDHRLCFCWVQRLKFTEKLVFYSLYTLSKRQNSKYVMRQETAVVTEFYSSGEIKHSCCLICQLKQYHFYPLHSQGIVLSFSFCFSSRADTYCFRAREYQDTRQKNISSSSYDLYSSLTYHTG